MRANARRQWTAALALPLVIGAVLALLLAPASALAGKHHRSQQPQLTWALPATASAGQPTPFTWTGSHLGKGHKLVVQKPEGTAHTWRSIMRLNGNSGSSQLPGVTLGHYRFRIADLAPVPRPPRRGHRQRRPHFRVMAEEVSGVAVFGEVPFTTLFGNSDAGVATTPTTTFPYVHVWRTVGAQQALQPAFKVERNDCISVHIAFISSPNVESWEELAAARADQAATSITVVQEARDPITATSPFEAVGSLDADLVPGQTWAMNLAIEAGSASSDSLTYINGYAICDSAEPFN